MDKQLTDAIVRLYRQVNADTKWSVDEFLLHPQASLKFCDQVREKLKEALANVDILRTLMNARKRGKLNTGKRRS